MSDQPITGKVEYARFAIGGRWLVTLSLREKPPESAITEHQVEILGPDAMIGQFIFDDEVVPTGSDLVRRLIDANGTVNVTIHPNHNSYIKNAKAEFVTIPFPPIQ